MPKIQFSAGRFSLTIPGAIIRQKRWKAGKEIAIAYDQDGNLILKAVE